MITIFYKKNIGFLKKYIYRLEFVLWQLIGLLENQKKKIEIVSPLFDMLSLMQSFGEYLGVTTPSASALRG